jgi:hypothetical protein
MATEVKLDGSGRAQLQQAAITIRAPGWSGSAQVRDRTSSAGRTRGDADLLPLAPFDEAEMNVVADIEIRAGPDHGGASSTRSGGAPGTIHVSLDTPRSDRNYALLQKDPSGLLRWVFPEEDVGIVNFALAKPTEEASSAEDSKRGVITGTMRIGARVVSWATKDVLGKLACEVAHGWEQKRRPYFLKAIAHDGAESEPDWQKLMSGRTLLLVHGTFSTPGAGFHGLFGSAEFETILAHYQRRCLAFAHPSLHADIENNLDQLIANLSNQMPKSAALDVDIVCHSRGGLVSRAIAAAANAGRLPLRVYKLIMVAAPNRGTPLTDVTHWKDFIDRHTNLLVTLPDSVSTVALEGVLCLVKIIGGGAVEGLPGLAAMQADGQQLATLRTADLGDVGLYAIVADFKPESDSPLGALMQKGSKAAVDAFFAEPNDLVVPTAGCHDLKGTKHFPLLRDRIHEFSGGSVNHVNFFLHQEVRQTLAGLLTKKAETADDKRGSLQVLDVRQ